MTIAENVQRVREEIETACARAGRDPASVTLIAVSKTHPAEYVLEAAAAGLQHFGENRVEEAIDKIPAVTRVLSDRELVWHMIGHVQSRKAREIPALFQVVHSVDSVKLAEKLSREVVERGGSLDVLLEVNIAGEASKSGYKIERISEQATLRETLIMDALKISQLPGLRVRGLMTVAPIVEHMEQARPVFAGLAALRQTVSDALKIELPELSMGMTDDYPVAIEEGATLVRIGRALFGERERL